MKRREGATEEVGKGKANGLRDAESCELLQKDTHRERKSGKGERVGSDVHVI